MSETRLLAFFPSQRCRTSKTHYLLYFASSAVLIVSLERLVVFPATGSFRTGSLYVVYVPPPLYAPRMLTTDTECPKPADLAPPQHQRSLDGRRPPRSGAPILSGRTVPILSGTPAPGRSNAIGTPTSETTMAGCARTRRVLVRMEEGISVVEMGSRHTARSFPRVVRPLEPMAGGSNAGEPPPNDGDLVPYNPQVHLPYRTSDGRKQKL